MGSSAQDPGRGEIGAQDQSRALESACCAQCGWPLVRRQRRFCSRKCCSAWWDARHPRVNLTADGPRQGTIQAALLAVLSDGEWRTKEYLATAVRAHEHSVGTRLSELRRKGFRIESDAEVGCSARAHRFRLVLG